MSLRSPFYRHEAPSIALLSHMQSHFDQPSIGFDRPSSIPPIPPSAIEARATGLRRPCLAPRLRKGKRPHQPITLVNIQQHRRASIPRRCHAGLAERVTHGFPAISRANAAVYSTTRQRACWPFFVRRADIKTAHVHRLRHCGPTPLPFVLPSRQCLVSAGRVCTRALSRPLTLLEADARASRARRNAEATRNPCKAPSQKNPAGTGGGEENLAPARYSTSSSYTAPPFPKSGPARFQKVGELTHGI